MEKKNSLLIAIADSQKVILLNDSQKLAIQQGIDIVRNNGKDIAFQKTLREFQAMLEKAENSN